MDLDVSPTSVTPKKRRKISLDNKMEVVSSLLNQWGFPELIQLFKDEEIDIDALLIMQPEFRKLVTTKLSIGRQIKFTKFLEDWQFEQANKTLNINSEGDIQAHVDNSIECKSETSRRNSFSKSNCTELLKILNSCYDGKTILKLHSKSKDLNESARNTLLNLISTYYNSKNGNGKLSELLADQVKTLFPGENRDMYLLKKKNRSKPIIKIYNKFANGKGKLTKADILQKIHKKRSPRKSKSPSKLPYGIEEGAKQHNLYLLSNTCPWADVEERWVRCQKFRANFLNEHSTEQILKIWPSYTQPLGYRLIDKDYEFKYPHSESLIEKWPNFEIAILPILKNQLKKPNLVTQIEELDKLTNKDGKVASIFLLLHHILVPTSKYMAKDSSGKKISKKYTIEDSQESFIKIASNNTKVQEKLNELREQASPIQPFIFFVGESIYDPTEIMVYFDDIKYKCSSTLKAVDICFKIFHVFNLEYPPAAFTFWTFVQTYIYNVYTEYDVDCISATNLKEELEKDAETSVNSKVEEKEKQKN
ncbi:uncharacterized protein LOC129615312 [Condylostylus longicornis]|uniref:uncharacterized protein LOC129615312 n=1 Tax=Condylostylus longicornis TaxID=2530218 RepID=UPI00244DB5A6|nr:uncharacterized protein LOC129615312 [Condylostylus longicornis]